MKKFKHITLYFCSAVVIYFIGGQLWLHRIDPAFLPNQLYRVIFYRFGPLFSLLLTLYIIIKGRKRYKSEPSYRCKLQLHFDEFSFKGKCKLLFTLLFSPIIISIIIMFLTVPAIEIYGHYYYAKPWSQEYYLLEVENCRRGYGHDCSSIKLKELNSGFRPIFRWYEDRAELAQLKTQRITLRGYEGLFGSSVEEIQWQ